MPSDHRSRAETHPAHNGKPEPRRVHKLLFPVPKLKDPIDPALLQHEKERADAGPVLHPLPQARLLRKSRFRRDRVFSRNWGPLGRLSGI